MAKKRSKRNEAPPLRFDEKLVLNQWMLSPFDAPTFEKLAERQARSSTSAFPIRRAKFNDGGDQKYVEKAHRRCEVGWNVGRRMEVAPHYRRPHLMLAWTGANRAVSKIVPRRGTIVHREKFENVPSAFGGEE